MNYIIESRQMPKSIFFVLLKIKTSDSILLA